ncbi:MAG: hypothetical protein QOH01_1791 [Verrucomicrobiota bacterium]
MAFHVHSPGSYDWGSPKHADAGRNEKARFAGDAGVEEFLNELAREFQIVCITDHMKLDYACRLGRASLARNDIRVLPGMEVNCAIRPGTQRIHLLVIFPPQKNAAAIERIFAGLGDFPADADRTGNEQIDIDSLDVWAAKVAEEGGMLIVAHIDDFHRGHRAYFRSLREDSLRMFLVDANDKILKEKQEISEEYLGHISTSRVSAIEIMKPEDRHHFLSVKDSNGKALHIPCVARNDAHCVEDFGRREKKTFIKVARLDFESVRDALKFHETRIKFHDDLPIGPSPRIVGMRLRSPGGTGVFREGSFAFNQNLNCIIGPRGSGKSTVIEALRYALGCNRALSELALGDAQTNFQNIALGIQKANLEDTIIDLVFENRDGARHYLSATYDPHSDTVTEVFDLAGDRRLIASEQISVDYPVRIYSWSEIENLGRQPELQRALLDRLVERLPEYCDKRAAIYSRLAENRRTIETLCDKLTDKLAEEQGLVRRFTEYKVEFDRINTPEIAGLFEDLDAARDRVGVLKAFAGSLIDVRDTIRSAANVTFPTVIAEILSDTSDAVRAWWELEVSVRLRPLEIGDTIAALASQVESRVEEKLLSLRSLIDTENASIAASEATLRERTQTSAEDELVRGKREQSKGRFDAASAKRVEYNELSAALEALLEERCGIVSQLDGVQDSIAGARSASRDALEIALGRFTAPGMTVSIEFRAGKDRTRVTRFLRDEGFLAMQPFGHYRASRFAERCIEMASPTRIARAILTQSGAVLTEEGIDIDRDALCQAEVNLLLNHFNAFAEDEDAAVRVVNSERLNQVLQLQEQPWDDELRILMNERPVDQLSPGQRSSAMLPLIALSEKVPLIIDQPEDNLDNRMVGSTLTKILADLKENRQIIVATHNPNIVVGGDAEQVIVLDAPEARRAVVVRSGSIDDSDVIDSVLAIMEGGKEAFQAREKRYQQHLL